MARVRLDTLLAERGLYESRSRAAAAVLAGEVFLGVGRARADKPGQQVDAGVHVEVEGRACLDVGASTGGFTDCLLQRGAAHVVALDVAYGELHLRLRDDPRVTVIERVNAREVRCEALPYRPTLVVADVSFISLTKVLPAVLACVADAFDCLAMVKPQFEVGRERISRGGVVREPADRRAALLAVSRAAVSGGA